MKYHLILVNFLIVCAKSAEISPGGNSDVICNTPECQQLLQNRLQTIEAAVRTIVTTLSSQTDELFAPVKEIFAKDLAINSIISATTTTRPNSTASATTNSSAPITTGNSEILQQGKNLVDNLKGVVKCSLAHFVDISTIDFESNLVNSSSVMTTTFSTKNEALEIVWPALSAECLKQSSGVWIRLYQINSEITEKSSVETSLTVPQKCIKKNSRNTQSIVLYPPSSSGNKDPCVFFLARNLTQCRSYNVEVIPNFQALRGKTLRTEIVIPPKLSGDSAKSLLDIALNSNSNSLKFNWKDNSGCAPQMTSLNLKVLQDGFPSNEITNNTLRIPRSCLREDSNENSTFSMSLPINPQTCPIEWKPLDKCRKYTFDMSSRYTATWNGHSTFVDIFTGNDRTKGNDANLPIFSNIGYNVNQYDYHNRPLTPWRCPKKRFVCSYYNSCDHYSDVYFVCNGNNDCINGRDEEYCDQTVCKDGFKCGKQCIPKELVCNGQHNCLDGSDEYYGCIYADACQHLTDSSGNFSSRKISRPADEIHSERVFDAALKTTVLISVPSNQQIWLSFDKCVTLQHFVKIYDGPYSTSPLLLSTSGSVQPFSVRSSSNELYVEFPSYYDPSYGISAYYTSINKTNVPFVPGCGGYIYGHGVIPIPNYMANDPDITNCFWFVEARDNNTLLLSSPESLSSIHERYPDARLEETDLTQENTTLSTQPLLPYPDGLPSLIVYDGWNPSGLVLYNRKDSMNKTAMYSISNKMLVHFKPPAVVNYNISFSLTVSQISTSECQKEFEGANGIIKSPNYPQQVYPNLVDCRWNIKVKPKSKVRLLFAFFETQAEKDFLYIYDGPSVYSKVLFKQSGLISTPFEVNSTTNQVLVRLTSDGDISFPGFLAVYSSV